METDNNDVQEYRSIRNGDFVSDFHGFLSNGLGASQSAFERNLGNLPILGIVVTSLSLVLLGKKASYWTHNQRDTRLFSRFL